jgi:hypothetical protein
MTNIRIYIKEYKRNLEGRFSREEKKDIYIPKKGVT